MPLVLAQQSSQRKVAEYSQQSFNLAFVFLMVWGVHEPQLAFNSLFFCFVLLLLDKCKIASLVTAVNHFWDIRAGLAAINSECSMPG